MEYALLYTFSTIAQALGGAFALLAAFVLYRFQSLDKILDGQIGNVRGILAAHQENNIQWFDTLRAQGKLRELLSEIENAVTRIGVRAEQGQTDSLHSGHLEILDRLRASVALRAHLATWFRRAAFTTGAVMLYSVAALPFAHFVYCSDMVSSILLIVGIGGFSACLYMYWVVIMTALFRQ
jgi:hypothetical protein